MTSSAATDTGPEAAPGGRAVCYRCFKAQVVCVCGDVARVDNRTEVIILQHPRERHHPIGTARFAALGLERARVLECGPKDPRTLLRCRDLPAGAALLYPGPAARDLEALSAAERPSHLVVLDGTWHHAKRIYAAAPWLHTLAHVQLRPAQPGAYRIRKEPRPECLSTIEAVVMALSVLEPETPGLDTLLAAFARMVDRQIDFREGRQSRRQRTWQRKPRRLPRLLVERRRDLVLVFGEVVPVLGAPGATRLAYWAALRPATGERFEHYLGPEPGAADGDLVGTGLDATRVRQGGDRAGLAAAWARFARPDDVLVSWNAASLGVLDGGCPHVLLKAAYCNLLGGAAGHIDTVLRRHDISAGPPLFPGRAGARLANALAVLEWLLAKEQLSGTPG